jgi:hypothetical protein
MRRTGGSTRSYGKLVPVVHSMHRQKSDCHERNPDVLLFHKIFFGLKQDETIQIMPPLSSLEIDIALIDVATHDKALHHDDADSLTSRSVSFASRDEIIRERCHSSRATWVSKEDLGDFKLDNARTIQIIMAGKQRKFNDVCEQGLESMSKAGSLQLQSRRKYARRVVLEEQKTQRREWISDPERIADEYQKATVRSSLVASTRGQADAFVVENSMN